MPLGNWEGEVSDEAEPEELPSLCIQTIPASDGTELSIFITLFCFCAQKSVFYFVCSYYVLKSGSFRSKIFMKILIEVQNVKK